MKSITEASLGDMQRIDNYFKEVQKMQIYVPLNTQRIDIEELDRQFPAIYPVKSKIESAIAPKL